MNKDNNYELLEKEIELIDKIEDWNEKILKIKKIKNKIILEQKKINDLINNIFKNENENTDNIDNNMDFNELLNYFKKSSELNEKIKYYKIISKYLINLEKELFIT